MSALNEAAMLIQLNVSQWTAKRLDQSATNDVLAKNQAVVGSGRFNKDLLPNNKELKAVHKQTTAIRQAFYENTLPWAMSNTQMLASKNYMHFTQVFNGMKQDWKMLVNRFLLDYTSAIGRARSDLGTMFDANAYPSTDEVSRKFSCQFTVMPVPTDDFRVAIADAELEKLRGQVKTQVSDALRNANKELYQRLYDRVKHMAERLGNPDATFRESMVTNLQDMVDAIPRLNFSDDAELNNLRGMVQSQLLSIKNPDTLRHDTNVRTVVANSAAEITRKMASLMGQA